MARASGSGLIQVFFMLVIGASLAPALASIIASPGSNITGATLALYSLITLIFVIIMMYGAIKHVGG